MSIQERALEMGRMVGQSEEYQALKPFTASINSSAASRTKRRKSTAT